MPASGQGDIRTVLTLEDFEYIHGLRDAADETEKFARRTKGIGGQMGGGMGMGFTQVAFAAQDFQSILSMGGKNSLGRALMSTMNNVQMLGAAFGPWGLAVTAAAGAVGAVLIPKLFEGKGAFDEIADSTAFATGRLETFIKRQQEMVRFQSKLGEATPADIGKAGKDIAGERRAAEINAEAIHAQIVETKRQIKEQKEAKRAGAAGFMAAMPLPDIFNNPMALGPLTRLIGGSVSGGGNIAELEKQLAELIKKYGEAGAAVGDLITKEDALGDRREGAVEDAGRLAAEEEDFLGGDKFRRDMEKRAEAFRSPFEAAQAKIEEIGKLFESGFMSPEQAKAASDRIVDEFNPDKGDKRQMRTAGAAERGSREAMSAIAAAMRQASAEPQKKLVNLAEQANILRTNAQTILERIEQKLSLPPVQI